MSTSGYSWVEDYNKQIDVSPWQDKYKSAGISKTEPYGDFDPDDLPDGTRRLVETDGNKALRPLTAHDGVKLREEVVSNDGSVSDWRGARWQYQNWLEGYTEDSGALVFEDADGDRTTVEPNVRFSPDGAKREYSRLADLERGLRHDWGEFTTALISLTSSSRNARGGWRCPADHLDDQTSSWDAVRDALSRAVPDDREYVYARVLEPHESGYAHTHVAVFVQGHVSKDIFRRPVEAHLRNCAAAGEEAHEDAVSVNRVTRRGGDDEYLGFDGECPVCESHHDDSDHNPDEDDLNEDEEYINNLSAYLSSYMADTFEDIEERPTHVRQFNALLWATNTRRVSYSQNAYGFMDVGKELRGADEDDEDKDLKLLGYTPDGDADGEIYEVDRTSSSKPTLVTSGLALPYLIDPPPDYQE